MHCTNNMHLSPFNYFPLKSIFKTHHSNPAVNIHISRDVGVIVAIHIMLTLKLKHDINRYNDPLPH